MDVKIAQTGNGKIIKESVEKLPISDHQAKFIAKGLFSIVSFNMWGVGAPIGPACYPWKLDGNSQRFRILDIKSRETHLDAIADYVIAFFKAGVNVLAFQELPLPYGKAQEDKQRQEFDQTHLEYFIAKLKERAVKENIALDYSALLTTFRRVRNPRESTVDMDAYHDFGNALLVVKGIDVKPLDDDPSIEQRSFAFNLSIGKKEKMKLTNLHGDYGRPVETAEFIVKEVENGCVVVGDTNIRSTSNAAKRILANINGEVSVSTPPTTNKVEVDDDSLTFDVCAAQSPNDLSPGNFQLTSRVVVNSDSSGSEHKSSVADSRFFPKPKEHGMGDSPDFTFKP